MWGINMATLDEVFEQSTDAVFGIDEAGSIRFANSKFERLLGYSCKQLYGTSCTEVLCCLDLHRQTFCDLQCPFLDQFLKTTASQHYISDFDLMIKHANGDYILVNIGANYILPQLREETGVVYVFFSIRQVNLQHMLQHIATATFEESLQTGMSRCNRLTSREKEILVLAAKGMKTSQIAHSLSISIHTVRSHFKNIYPKISVNNRTEAIMFAMQHRLH